MTTQPDPSIQSVALPHGRRLLAKTIGLAALGGTIIPPALFMFGHLPHSTMQIIMLAAAIAWFAAAPFWMNVD